MSYHLEHKRKTYPKIQNINFESFLDEYLAYKDIIFIPNLNNRRTFPTLNSIQELDLENIVSELVRFKNLIKKLYHRKEFEPYIDQAFLTVVQINKFLDELELLKLKL